MRYDLECRFVNISFIVSAYHRPTALACALASLRQQDIDLEIVVCDNSTDPKLREQQRSLCAQFGARHVDTEERLRLAGSPSDCYWSAESVVPETTGEWLCFPSDDSYYVPEFSRTLIEAGEKNGWDLVFCDTVYDRRAFGDHYDVLRTEPCVGKIDKTGFILRRSRFTGFPGKVSVPGPCCADGFLIEALVAAGCPLGKVCSVLVVHN